MISGNYGLIDGSLIQQLRFDTLSNNLANVNTNGFKKDILAFDEALSMKILTAVDFSPGPVVSTGNKFDVALNGPGFFKIQTPSGIKYSRDGAFSLSRDGMLVNHNGDQVLGQNGPITLSGGDLSIGRDGQISENGSPGDKLLVVDFKEPQLLKKEGMNYYVYGGKEQDILTAEKVDVQHKYIEKSNVNVTEEMIRMVDSFRAFESIQKAIQNTDEITSKLVNDPELL
ncbi:MAG: flagellar hook-basal body protein [Desulfobacteraceae bacterium]|nr:MAG: flagellar hook-basal body protein [Desulfobacteraceae bacterium]